ncbi:MAG TPA: aspartate aminotransferase family protein [Rhodospirillales bacterium]|jgi:acetylornithine/N-succinyldiaminopimelate aminotransferase|nr:MAG: Succinylornithine transaminase/acetylornithine aminotransferase [Alphaproteobacteria bacterium MarineAlpha3_Bin2]HIC29326.1 aspartate aminotransferase family protein [Rhodospirillales bacterium]HIM76979.1 aspartate aminotransferase family protein [Rhodospirillales bacterium]
MISPVMANYARADIAFEKGEGVYLYASDGTRYLDFGGGIAVTCLGHCHPHLVEALTRQAGQLWHCSNLYQIPEQTRLAERLVAASFADSVVFINSGAEAVETSVKMARKYQSDQGHPERFRVITCEGAFHGRTLAMIAAGGQEKHLAGFGPVVDGFDQVAFDNLNEMRAAVGPETAALLIEPVQGEGGIRALSKDYLKGARALADEFGVLLILDEVQTGIGRTGKLFAHEWAGIEPDILASAKGLGGGFPIGACLAKEGPASALTAGSHGSTFGGNPLAMAVGNAVLDVVLETGFLDKANAIAKRLWQRLEEIAVNHPTVFEGISGSGLMVGLKCVPTNMDVVAKLTEGGLLTVAAGENVVRLVPPLIIEDSHVDEAIAIIDKAAGELDA